MMRLIKNLARWQSWGVLAFVGVLLLQVGCTGKQAFTNAARAGDTVAVAFGRQENSTRDNTIVSIRDFAGNVTTYNPGDPAVRSIINFYPDPASYLVVGTETAQDIRGNETVFGNDINTQVSSGNPDWWMTTAILDLPATLALGRATISLDINGFTESSTLEILPGVGAPNPLEVVNSPGPGQERLASLERSPSYGVRVFAPIGTNPQGLEVTFSHDPDVDNAGQGRAHVINPRGDYASINWEDDGTTLKVLVTPARDAFARTKKEMRFYVAGGITGLTVQDVKGFDENGVLLSAVSVGVTPMIRSITPAGPIVPGTTVTVEGDFLCKTCGTTPDSDVWLKLGPNWSQISATSVTESAITFDVPATAPPGSSVFWVGTAAGEADKWFVVQ